ncbi:MAG: TIGR04282 family arsenosugar biosynthesis glycosyltransferase [Cyclobacteriaceae bacterium]|nr:TIGR04282 family arsenosugar biosynthesis glycosyltransferase [Cyclobacteriaceae bacterium]
MTEELLIVYVKNPVPGLVKTRLAAEVGAKTACRIYEWLLRDTKSAVEGLPMDVRLSYHSTISRLDMWDNSRYQKTLQKGSNLGEKMYHDIHHALDEGYKKVCLIGSDIYGLDSDHLLMAFNVLDSYNTVIGPARDGGYYLIGFTAGKKDIQSVFDGISWGSSMVMRQTTEKLGGTQYGLIETLRDIDELDDLPESWRKGLGDK